MLSTLRSRWDRVLEKAQDTARPALSLSMFGQCRRQLAYRLVGTKPMPHDVETLRNFDDGNMHHEWARKHLKRALRGTCLSLVDQEREVEIALAHSIRDGTGLIPITEIPEGTIIKGHIDGLLKHSEPCTIEDCLKQDILLEVKSMSPYAFDRTVKEGKVDAHYEAQVQAYMRALGLSTTLFLLKNKATGQVEWLLTKFDPVVYSDYEDSWTEVLGIGKPEESLRDYGPDKDGNLPWQCAGCPFWDRCWNGKAKKEAKWRLKLLK